MISKPSGIRLLPSFFLALLCVTLATLCLAQTPSATSQRPRKVFPAEQEPAEVLRTDTDLVSVDVTATNPEGLPVRNLRQGDFEVFSDGLEQQVSFFHVERRDGEPRPLAIVFALDISGSMTADEMERLRGALRSFSGQLSSHPVVYAVMAFGMHVKTLQRFTSEADKLDRTFDRLAREPNGLSTHTYDAVDDAIRLIVKQAPKTREHRVMKRANAADVSVYVVTLPSYAQIMPASTQTPLPTPLDVSGLAEATGGRNAYANEKDYGPLFRALAEEVSSAYVLAFYPTEEKRHDGQVHTIRVEGPRGLTLRPRRSEYRAKQ